MRRFDNPPSVIGFNAVSQLSPSAHSGHCSAASGPQQMRSPLSLLSLLLSQQSTLQEGADAFDDELDDEDLDYDEQEQEEEQERLSHDSISLSNSDSSWSRARPAPSQPVAIPDTL
ncbi:hypothetical protein V8C86DRAFT_3100458 [Haematococcus lacustris]